MKRQNLMKNDNHTENLPHTTLHPHHLLQYLGAQPPQRPLGAQPPEGEQVEVQEINCRYITADELCVHQTADMSPNDDPPKNFYDKLDDVYLDFN